MLGGIGISTGVNEEGGNVTNEAWFDAEEDLGAQAGQGTKEERLRKAMENERSGAGMRVWAAVI